MIENLKKFTRNEILSIGGILLAIIIFIILGSQIDLSFINVYIERAGIWAPLLFILAKSSTIIFSPLSGTPLYLFAGTMFGIEGAIIYSALGDFLGFSFLFLVSRRYGKSVLKFFTRTKGSRPLALIRENTEDLKSFIKICFVFFWFPEICVAAAGLGKLSYFKAMAAFMPIYITFTTIVILISTTFIL